MTAESELGVYGGFFEQVTFCENFNFFSHNNLQNSAGARGDRYAISFRYLELKSLPASVEKWSEGGRKESDDGRFPNLYSQSPFKKQRVTQRNRSEATAPTAPRSLASRPPQACHPSSTNSNKVARIPGSWNGEERSTEPTLRTSGTWIKLVTQRCRAPPSRKVRGRVLQTAEVHQRQVGDNFGPSWR